MYQRLAKDGSARCNGACVFKRQSRQAIIGCLVVCVRGCVLHGFACHHRPAHSELVGEYQPGFTKGRPAQFGFLIDGELRMMEAALGLRTKCREVMTIYFGNVCHVSNFSETEKHDRRSAPAIAKTLPTRQNYFNSLKKLCTVLFVRSGADGYKTSALPSIRLYLKLRHCALRRESAAENR